MAENPNRSEETNKASAANRGDDSVWLYETNGGPSQDRERSQVEHRESEAKGNPESNALGDEWFSHLKTAGATPVGPAKPAKDHSSPIKILENPVPVDRDRKVTVVLDDYRYHDMQVKDEFGFSHGELSARMAQENDLNVMRIQVAMGKRSKEFRLDHSFEQLNEQIDSGKIDLRKGDIINVSFGLSKTYESMSNLLRMDITPENVKEKREEIFQAMKDRLTEKGGLSLEERELLEECVGITDGIKKMQERGIKVINAAGNEGPDQFNIGFLAADKQYSALDASGKQAEYSAKNSFTEDGRGSIDLYYHPIDLLDKTPIGEQQGYYSLEGSKIKLAGSEFGGIPFEKPQFQFQSHLDLNKELGKQNLDSKPSENLSFVKIQAKRGVPDFAHWRKGHLAMHTHGTSFVNVFKLKEEYQKD